MKTLFRIRVLTLVLTIGLLVGAAAQEDVSAERTSPTDASLLAAIGEHVIDSSASSDTIAAETAASVRPDPVPSAIPDPVTSAQPDMATSVQSDPVTSAQPDPVTSAQPDPVPSAQPDPVPSAQPDPVTSAQPDPVPSAIPDPVTSAQPDPVPSAIPDPVPSAVPDPVPSVQPEPVTSAQPDPIPSARSDPELPHAETASETIATATVDHAIVDVSESNAMTSSLTSTVAGDQNISRPVSETTAVSKTDPPSDHAPGDVGPTDPTLMEVSEGNSTTVQQILTTPGAPEVAHTVPEVNPTAQHVAVASEAVPFVLRASTAVPEVAHAMVDSATTATGVVRSEPEASQSPAEVSHHSPEVVTIAATATTAVVKTVSTTNSPSTAHFGDGVVNVAATVRPETSTSLPPASAATPHTVLSPVGPVDEVTVSTGSHVTVNTDSPAQSTTVQVETGVVVTTLEPAVVAPESAVQEVGSRPPAGRSLNDEVTTTSTLRVDVVLTTLRPLSEVSYGNGAHESTEVPVVVDIPTTAVSSRVTETDSARNSTIPTQLERGDRANSTGTEPHPTMPEISTTNRPLLTNTSGAETTTQSIYDNASSSSDVSTETEIKNVTTRIKPVVQSSSDIRYCGNLTKLELENSLTIVYHSQPILNDEQRIDLEFRKYKFILLVIWLVNEYQNQGWPTTLANLSDQCDSFTERDDIAVNRNGLELVWIYNPSSNCDSGDKLLAFFLRKPADYGKIIRYNETFRALNNHQDLLNCVTQMTIVKFYGEKETCQLASAITEPFYMRHSLLLIVILAVAIVCIIIIILGVVYIRCCSFKRCVSQNSGYSQEKTKLHRVMHGSEMIGADLNSEDDIHRQETFCVRNGNGFYGKEAESAIPIGYDDEGCDVIPYDEISAMEKHATALEDTKL